MSSTQVIGLCIYLFWDDIPATPFSVGRLPTHMKGGIIMQREQLKINGLYSSLSLSALILLLSACAIDKNGDTSNGGGGGQQAMLIVGQPTQLMFDTKVVDPNHPDPMTHVNIILDSKEKLLAELRPQSSNPGDTNVKLRELIDDVREKNANASGGGVNDSGTKPFRGLGGGYYHTLLRAAQGKVKQSDGSYDEDFSVKASVELTGLITAYGFGPDGVHDGKETGSGNLTVDTYQTVKHGSATVEVHNYLWEIEIKNKGYVIHPIQHENAPDPDTWTKEDWKNWDPFPGTLFFSVDMKKRIHEKGFNVKLHARGKNAIKIKSVWKDGFRIRNSNKDLKPLLKPDEDSCIDIFLVVADKNDPATIPTGTLGEHSYCLGRCENPAIINSR